MSEKETRALMMTFTKAKRDEMKDHLIPYDDFGVTPLHIAAKVWPHKTGSSIGAVGGRCEQSRSSWRNSTVSEIQNQHNL